jgi:hypothetical protein
MSDIREENFGHSMPIMKRIVSNDGDEPVQMERLTVVRRPAVLSSMDLKSSFRNKTQDKRMQVKFVDFKLPDHN